MHHSARFCLITLMLTLAVPGYADINRVAWLDGAWGGGVGEAYLEENWSPPRAGMMQARVRMSSAGRVQMIEMITIREEGEDLMLYIQQFGTDLTPRFDPLPMRATLIENNHVSFTATQAGGLKTVTYRRDGDDFNITVELSEGTNFIADLKRIAN